MVERPDMDYKLDVKRTVDGYQARRGVFRIVDLPDARYLMVDGSGDPNTSPEYASALETLYPTAYTVKSATRSELGTDFVVPPLEGLWWADDMDAFTRSRDKSRWSWTMMILVPDVVPSELVDAAIAAVRAKKRPPRIDDLRFETLSEGLVVQTLHLGSFDDEGPVLDRMHHGFIPDNGLSLTGRHHEIYFSDPRRTPPEKLRTILRQPVARG
jgi:hypothetical protein